jgi:hypothetical protein
MQACSLNFASQSNKSAIRSVHSRVIAVGFYKRARKSRLCAALASLEKGRYSNYEAKHGKMTDTVELSAR